MQNNNNKILQDIVDKTYDHFLFLHNKKNRNEIDEKELKIMDTAIRQATVIVKTIFLEAHMENTAINKAKVIEEVKAIN